MRQLDFVGEVGNEGDMCLAKGPCYAEQHGRRRACGNQDSIMVCDLVSWQTRIEFALVGTGCKHRSIRWEVDIHQPECVHESHDA